MKVSKVREGELIHSQNQCVQILHESPNKLQSQVFEEVEAHFPQGHPVLNQCMYKEFEEKRKSVQEHGPRICSQMNGEA